MVSNSVPVIRNSVPVQDATAGAVTYTAAQCLQGIILRDPNGGAVSDVTPTAALIIAELQKRGLYQGIGTTFEFLVVNEANAAEVLTITAGANVTLVPASVTPTQNESTRIRATVTSSTTVRMDCQTVGA